MCNLSLTPHSSLEKDSLNHSRVSRRMSCLAYRGAIQVLRNADGGGGCPIFQKKTLRRCKLQRYLALRGGGWGSNFQEKSVT